ncbi:uncharacterized protein RMCB_2004 [Mycolicibacterium brisbanense]|uniref:Uncharacterized protein n=1 Tax=Mycolicibacterium brisbanense TaxID=146020 RepID=A0A100VXQ3_9MYCO|nr:uncharacterized protein RMCB_2004 [Mycolicibacterium brisbanense]
MGPGPDNQPGEDFQPGEDYQPGHVVLPGEPIHSGPPQQGSIRWQEPGVTKPRPPTVAEARQRDKARKAREAAEQWAALQEQKREERQAHGRKVFIGSVAVVGVVGAVALGYYLLHQDQANEVSATCVKDGTNEVVPDSYCSDGYAGSHSTFIYAGSPYRYYYGGSSGGIGSIARGGTIEIPKGTTARTSSGQSITKSGSSVSRGGFGSKSSGSSGS